MLSDWDKRALSSQADWSLNEEYWAVNGFSPAGPKKRIFSAKEIQLAINLYAKDLSIFNIAEVLGSYEEAISQLLRRSGVVIKKKGWPKSLINS